MAKTRLTFYAGTLPHFCNFLAPLWHGLPDGYRGEFHARGRAAKRAMEVGIEPIVSVPQSGLVCVASFEDYRATKNADVVLVNHGVGMTYNGDSDSKAYKHPSYSGGIGRERVVLYLCPSESDVKVNVEAYPDADAIAVGPYHLDRWMQEDLRWGWPGPWPKEWPEKPIVVFSSHADIHICPETRSAFSEYEDAIRDLVRSDPPYTIWGHAHPRNRRHMEKFWSRLGVPFVADFSEVLDHASLYVSDNSSTLYEFAATNRPVLVLNAPWYRRNIHHGLRFWDNIPGWVVWRPDERPIADDIWYALLDGPRFRSIREQAVNAAYNGVTLDGRLTERAVAALTSFLDAR